MREPYGVLGLTSQAGEQELRARYEELRAKYGEERFLEGEAGNEGARKLMELEDAWALISADLQKRSYSSSSAGDYGQIDGLIKNGKYDEAQRQLDSITVRTAEWHYYQSIIYYKRDWLTESRAQLAMAVSMDPNNPKYTEALNKLDAVIGNPYARAQDLGGYQQQQRQQDNMGNALCRCCQMYICMDCCCTMMQCCR